MDTPIKVTGNESTATNKPNNGLDAPETIQTGNSITEEALTQNIHDIISAAQKTTLGEVKVPAASRNTNDTDQNAYTATQLEKNHPMDTLPTPKQTCEKCKAKLEKEAGEMDVQHLGTYLKFVCEREGGSLIECSKIEKEYHANQLHDSTNANSALGRFCSTFFDIPCQEVEVEDEGERVEVERVDREVLRNSSSKVQRRLRRR